MIREIAVLYSKLPPKNPAGLAKWLIYEYKERSGDMTFVHGGSLKFPVLFDLEAMGIPLVNKNRLLLFKTSFILIKAGYMFFLLGTTKIVMYKIMGSYKNLFGSADSLTNKPINQGVKDRLYLDNFHDVFASFGVTKGGVDAFFKLMKKLTQKNAPKSANFEFLDTKPQIGLVPILVDGKIPHIVLKTVPWHMLEEYYDDEEKKNAVKKKFQVVKLKPITSIGQPKPIVVKEKIVPDDLGLPKSDYGQAAKTLKAEIGREGSKALIKQFDFDEETAYSFVKSSIAGWADSSSTNDLSLRLQLAATKLFKLNGIPKWIKIKMIKTLNSNIDDDDAEFDPMFIPKGKQGLNVFEVLAQDIYRRTQELFKEKGVKELLLFRGMDDIKLNGIMKYTDIKLNPLNSFSTSPSTASGFGDYLLVARMPVSRIFSCAFTGHGCWGEDEYVVLGGKIKCHIFNTQEIIDKLYNLKSRLWKLSIKIEDKLDSSSNPSPKFKEMLKKVKSQMDILEGIEGGNNSTLRAIEYIMKHGLKPAKIVKAAEEEDPVNPSNTESNEPAGEPSGTGGEPDSAGGKKEEDMLEESEKDSDWIKVGLDTGSLPYIGTPEFEDYLDKTGKTFEQTLKSPAYRKAHIKFAPVVKWLQRMAVTMNKDKAKAQVKPIETVKKTLCHLATLNAVSERNRRSDKIWFFGETSADTNGSHPQVFHSLLTDYHNKVVANNYQGVGSNVLQFDPRKGYKTPNGEHIPILDVVSVGEFLDRFFRK